MSEKMSTCDRVAERLEALAAGSISRADGEIEAHLERCAGCRTLVELVRGEPQGVTAIPPADLADSILARTSGTACRQAAGLLCDLTDGALGPTDTALLRSHLSSCRTCAALSTALVRLAEALPALAEMEPDERFVDDVLARTLPLTSRLGHLAARLSERWAALVQRPRFSWEAAYIGAILLSLVFAAPASPLRHVPRQALAIVQANPIAALSADGQPSVVREKLAATGDFLWSWTGRPLGGALSDLKNTIVERYDRTAGQRASLRAHVTELGRTTVRMEGRGSLDALQGMGSDLKGIWNALNSGHEDDTNEETNKRSGEET